MSGPRRRPLPALQGWEYRGRLRTAYLGLYADEPEFRTGLLRLYAEHCAGAEQELIRYFEFWRLQCHVQDRAILSAGRFQLMGPPVPASGGADRYVAAATDLAAQYGLDRLQEGVEELHAWCWSCAYISLQRRRPPDPTTFGWIRSYGGARPDIGDVVDRQEWVLPVADDVRVRVVDERRAPIVHAPPADDEWDARYEPMAVARGRIVAAWTAHLDAELQRLAAAAEAQGYVFHDVAPKARQHLRWLFEHVALQPHRSYPELAAHDLGHADQQRSVENEVKKYAKLLGVNLARR